MAFSLVIGLEMLPYLAAAGIIVVLMWVRDAAEARRLAAYGISLGGGCAFGFLVFTSEANMAPLPERIMSRAPVAAPETIELSGSSFFLTVTMQQSMALNMPPHAAN